MGGYGFPIMGSTNFTLYLDISCSNEYHSYSLSLLNKKTKEWEEIEEYCSREYPNMTEAIKEFEDINDLPELYDEKCGGCGMCLAKCPGLAIYVVDATYSDTHAMMKIPYELLPLPEEGEMVMGLMRFLI